MPVIRREGLTPVTGSSYPAPFNLGSGQLHAWPFSDPGGLTQFGAYLEVLEPGAQTSQRHWHDREDEFLFLLEGELTLIEEDGPQRLRPGEAACWPAGVPNGHHVRNDGDRAATYLIVGTRSPDETCRYPDIDLVYRRENGVGRYEHRDGTPYPPKDGT